MFHNINNGFENVIEKKTAGEYKPFLFYIRGNLSLETLYNMGLFRAFEQQPNDSCVPLFLERDTTQWLDRAALSMSLACRAVSNLAWCRIFKEISCFPPLNIGTLFRCFVLGQGT